MNKQELWERYCATNPDFSREDARITLTGRGLKKLFDTTYDIAHRKGVEDGKAIERRENNKQFASNPFGQFFK